MDAKNFAENVNGFEWENTLRLHKEEIFFGAEDRLIGGGNRLPK